MFYTSSLDDAQVSKNRYKRFPRVTLQKLTFGRGVRREVRLQHIQFILVRCKDLSRNLPTFGLYQKVIVRCGMCIQRGQTALIINVTATLCHSGKLKHEPPIIQSKSDGGWSISKHVSIRKERLRQIRTLVLCVNSVFFNYANFLT